MRNALISVSDKTGIVEFAKKLSAIGFNIISTGGTENALRSAGLDLINISEVTNFPECLDGRVKTLHPAVHAGILAKREKPEHVNQIQALGIGCIDLVVVNLYPFKETVLNPKSTFEDAIENIDIGGPTMIRSAAKNHRDVMVVVDPKDYDRVVEALEKQLDSEAFRLELALKSFEHTAYYDGMIATYLREQVGQETFPECLTLAYEKVQEMRYGENPHQKAAFYKELKPVVGSISNAIQLHGKELSFNNINDANAALSLLNEFEKPAVVAVKHAAPCGVGLGIDLSHAYDKAYACDPLSIFGGVVALNRIVDLETAKKMGDIFLEIILAPGFEEDALEQLKLKKNVRVLSVEGLGEAQVQKGLDIKKVSGGVLVQESDQILIKEDLQVVTERIPTQNEMEALLFAWKVCKHVKSNGIVLAKGGQTIGIGQGQVSRVWAAESAIAHSNFDTKGSVLASDAFFPFSDAIEMAAKAGISAIIQPGGSIRDADVVEMANKHGIAMVFTGTRHFKH